MCHVFNGPGERRYVMTQEKLDVVITGIAQSIKGAVKKVARKSNSGCHKKVAVAVVL